MDLVKPNVQHGKGLKQSVSLEAANIVWAKEVALTGPENHCSGGLSGLLILKIVRCLEVARANLQMSLAFRAAAVA